MGSRSQWKIHLCCLQNWIRRRYLQRQKVEQNLDSDVPWCLPALECVLRRQHFRAFGRSLGHGAHGDGKHNKTVHGRDNVGFSQLLNKYSKTRTFKYHNLHFTKTVPGKEHLVQLVMTNSEKHYYSGSSWKMSNTYSWRILQILHLEYKSNKIKDKHKWVLNIWIWR